MDSRRALFELHALLGVAGDEIVVGRHHKLSHRELEVGNPYKLHGGFAMNGLGSLPDGL